jgi:hypothetical protein
VNRASIRPLLKFKILVWILMGYNYYKKWGQDLTNFLGWKNKGWGGTKFFCCRRLFGAALTFLNA